MLQCVRCASTSCEISNNRVARDAADTEILSANARRLSDSGIFQRSLIAEHYNVKIMYIYVYIAYIVRQLVDKLVNIFKIWIKDDLDVKLEFRNNFHRLFRRL